MNYINELQMSKFVSKTVECFYLQLNILLLSLLLLHFLPPGFLHLSTARGNGTYIFIHLRLFHRLNVLKIFLYFNVS